MYTEQVFFYHYCFFRLANFHTNSTRDEETWDDY